MDHGGDAAAVASWTANKTPEAFLGWLDQAGSSLFVATMDGTVAGVGMITHNAKIMLNYVSPPHQFILRVVGP